MRMRGALFYVVRQPWGLRFGGVTRNSYSQQNAKATQRRDAKQRRYVSLLKWRVFNGEEPGLGLTQKVEGS